MKINPRLELTPNQVHLWCCTPSSITDSTLLTRYHSLLSDTEKKRYQRFRFEKDRHRHLITRALIRTTLSRYIPQTSPQAWQFQHNAFGKPYITPTTAIRFNISHSQDMIAIGITLGQEIGIDIENIQERNNIEGLAEHCFNKDEQCYILAGKKMYLRHRFFQMWTLKESYIKAYGKGLAIALKDLHFQISENNIALKIKGKHEDDPLKWQFHSSQLTEEYQLAITLAQPSLTTPLDIKIMEFTPH